MQEHLLQNIHKIQSNLGRVALWPARVPSIMTLKWTLLMDTFQQLLLNEYVHIQEPTSYSYVYSKIRQN